MDFDEDGFFASKNYDIIIKVKKIREGNAEGGAYKVKGIDVRNFVAEHDVGELGF